MRDKHTIEPLERRSHFSVVAKLIEIPISAAARQADPALKNYRSFDLRVSVGVGDLWLSAGMHASLTKGQFYVPSTNADIAQPHLWQAQPNLKFDTFVTSTNFAEPSLGSGYLGLASRFSATKLITTWFNPLGGRSRRATAPQQFTIARITISCNAVGSISGLAGGPGAHVSRFFMCGAFGATTVGGQVFSDLYGVGTESASHGLGAGWRVYIDRNNNGVLDTGERSTLTDQAGTFYFTNLTAGTCTIRIVAKSGFEATTAPSQRVTVAAGQQRTDLLFGQRQI